MNIFKAYDIRGIYPKELNEEVAVKIGRALVKFIQPKKVVIGRDARLSSPALFNALVQGITESQVTVIDIGLATTPLYYWALIDQGADGGVMITASHNPKDYNGFKINRGGAKPISRESGLEEIKRLMTSFRMSSQPPKWMTPERVSISQVIKKNLLDEYIEFILSQSPLEQISQLKIVVDTGNGMAGLVVPKIFDRLNCQLIPLYFELDGSFPHHQPNPLKEENLRDLKEKVLAEKADLGIGFDGDGDRIIFVDERGQSVRGDFITALLAQEILNKNPGAKIFYEVRSSWIVKETIRENRGEPILGRAGHALIREQMEQEDILFGGELSGHYYFKEFFYCENALLTMLKVLALLSQSGKKFSEMIQPLKKYYQSGEINFSLKNKEGKIEEVASFYQGAKNVSYLDGLTVEYEDWWFNLRPSHTEPCLRLNIEAKTKELLEEKENELRRLILEQK